MSNPATQARPAPPQRRPTILLVDDNKEIRELFRLTLKDHGYQVLVAESGENALRICRLHAGTIDLLLVDAVMPAMSGMELAKQILALRPNIKRLFISGLLQESVLHGALRSVDAFLAKPVTNDRLVQKIQEMLPE